MAQAGRAGELPPIVPTRRSTGEEPWQAEPEVWGGRGLRGAAGSLPCVKPGPSGAPAAVPTAGGPIPPALQRLRRELLRLHREREQLLRARDCARRLQATARLLQTPSPGPGLRLSRDLLAPAAREPVPRRAGPREAPASLLPARPDALAAQRLEAALESQLRALGREPASPGLSSRLADVLEALPALQRLQARAWAQVPGAPRPFPAARALRVLTAERGCQLAGRLQLQALPGSAVRDRLRRMCREERELLPGLLGLLGGGQGPGLGGAGALWSQYWTLLWAACVRSLHLHLGPWSDPRAATHQLSQETGQGKR